MSDEVRLSFDAYLPRYLVNTTESLAYDTQVSMERRLLGNYTKYSRPDRFVSNTQVLLQ